LRTMTKKGHQVLR